MTQAFNLSQVANRIDSSGKLDGSTALTGLLPIANGGTNNASLGVTAGGIVSTNGSQLVNTGAGTSGQFLRSNGASAPTWQIFPSSAYTFLGGLTPTNGSSSITISGLNLTNYRWVYISVVGQTRIGIQQSINIGSAQAASSTVNAGGLVWGTIGIDLAYGFAGIGWNSNANALVVRFDHGYTTASTSITLTTTGITFNTAPFYFWGGI